MSRLGSLLVEFRSLSLSSFQPVCHCLQLLLQFLVLLGQFQNVAGAFLYLFSTEKWRLGSSCLCRGGGDLLWIRSVLNSAYDGIKTYRQIELNHNTLTCFIIDSRLNVLLV